MEFGKDSYWTFIDLEKAYDKVDRRLIVPTLRSYGVSEDMVEMVMVLYRDPMTKVRTCFGTTETFTVRIGLHQG